MFRKKNSSGKLPENLSIYEKVSNVPETAKITITSGRHEGLTYIKPQYVVEVLTEMFGVCGFGWIASYELIPQDSDQIVVVKCSLRVKLDGVLSEAIEGFGTAYSKAFNQETGKWTTSDDAYKAAQSDALRKASFNLGVGSSLFELSLPSSNEIKEEEVEEDKETKEEEKNEEKEIESIEEALNTFYEEGKTIKEFLSRCKTTTDKMQKLLWLVENREEAKMPHFILSGLQTNLVRKLVSICFFSFFI